MLYRRFATVFVLRFLWSHFQSQNWAIEKEKTSTEVLLLRFLMLSAVRGGFEQNQAMISYNPLAITI
jgi:predicted acyltransferase